MDWTGMVEWNSNAASYRRMRTRSALSLFFLLCLMREGGSGLFIYRHRARLQRFSVKRCLE